MNSKEKIEGLDVFHFYLYLAVTRVSSIVKKINGHVLSMVFNAIYPPTARSTKAITTHMSHHPQTRHLINLGLIDVI
jgi:hypothetical protein